ncbi:MAG: hypothetical protein MZU97_11180 [Bacillus subtilis]|nr:hypothetical protein [Bacillus subtilis]
MKRLTCSPTLTDAVAWIEHSHPLRRKDGPYPDASLAAADARSIPHGQLQVDPRRRHQRQGLDRQLS